MAKKYIRHFFTGIHRLLEHLRIDTLHASAAGLWFKTQLTYSIDRPSTTSVDRLIWKRQIVCQHQYKIYT